MNFDNQLRQSDVVPHGGGFTTAQPPQGSTTSAVPLLPVLIIVMHKSGCFTTANS
ncbi:MAG: hypothetical protein MI924_34130 [Chloroflexales bacterium]|nr:hypothetical protein [Chloroflexales bacterium]